MFKLLQVMNNSEALNQRNSKIIESESHLCSHSVLGIPTNGCAEISEIKLNFEFHLVQLKPFRKADVLR